MTVLVFLTLLFTFDKVNTIATTRSRWIVTFVIDLKPFELFINRMFGDILKSSSLAQEVIKRYDRPGKENFMNLKSEKVNGYAKFYSRYL